MSDDHSARHSDPEKPDLVTDADELARLEAKNGLKQFDKTIEYIDMFLNGGRPFRLRPSIIQDLHRQALEGISAFARNWRPAGVKISGSGHEPVGAHLVAEEIEALCDYVNDNFEQLSALHLTAYVMWRLNWIHPFSDGNGRTSRALAYLVLCVRAGMQLPGTNTIPEQISSNKTPYYEALEDADKQLQDRNEIDLSKMEELLDGMLAKQLVDLHDAAKAENAPGQERKFH